MKENAESINHNIFNHFPATISNNDLTYQFFHRIKKHIRSIRSQILNGFVMMGIGTIFLFSIYLFLIQLAEYGWQ
jgi:hypothetical protein